MKKSSSEVARAMHEPNIEPSEYVHISSIIWILLPGECTAVLVQSANQQHRFVKGKSYMKSREEHCLKTKWWSSVEVAQVMHKPKMEPFHALSRGRCQTERTAKRGNHNQESFHKFKQKEGPL